VHATKSSVISHTSICVVNEHMCSTESSGSQLQVCAIVKICLQICSILTLCIEQPTQWKALAPAMNILDQPPLQVQVDTNFLNPCAYSQVKQSTGEISAQLDRDVASDFPVRVRTVRLSSISDANMLFTQAEQIPALSTSDPTIEELLIRVHDIISSWVLLLNAAVNR
jgi:hypothetical protein